MGKKKTMQPGEKYWRWTYLREAEPERSDGKLRGVFRCDCGVEREVTLSYVRAGKSKSCGCLPRERIIAKVLKHGQSDYRKGQSGYYLYSLWSGIKHRTNSPNSRHYEWYGGRGITMHPAWVDDYVTFRDYVLAELGERPSKRHSLDRIDNEGNYEPGNIRWATPAVQGSNRRNNQLLTLNGRTQTASQWSRELNIPHQTLMSRLARGWTEEKALTEPIKIQHRRRTKP